jgi:hypothetical protein
MKPLVSLRSALGDPDLLGGVLGGPTVKIIFTLQYSSSANAKARLSASVNADGGRGANLTFGDEDITGVPSSRSAG